MCVHLEIKQCRLFLKCGVNHIITVEKVDVAGFGAILQPVFRNVSIS